MDVVVIKRQAPADYVEQWPKPANRRHAVIVWLPKDSAKQVNIIVRIAVRWFDEDSSVKRISHFCDIKPSKGFIEWQHISGSRAKI